MISENTLNNDTGEDFESLLEDSLSGTDSFSVGDKISGKVVFIDRENVFIDVTGKSDAIIDISEFRDREGNHTLKAGDIVEAYVVSISSGEIHLTKEIGRNEVSLNILQIAYENSIPVYGRINSQVKGGFSVSISNFNGFCPMSQVDIKTPANPEEMINRAFTFKINQLENNGRNIILSRRALLEEERKVKSINLKERLKENDTVTGVVTSVQNFGIFVDIGGIDALVPKSELSRSRNISMDTFSQGDEVTASVLSIDWESEKISLSMKRLMPDPWDTIERYQPGSKVNGMVTNIIKQGVFVELEPGLEGFIHISKLSRTKRINTPGEMVSISDRVNVRINDIKTDEKKISLELITGEADPWETAGEGIIGKVKSCTIEISKSSGLNVRLDNGMAGFIPREKLKDLNKGDIQKSYSVGSTIKAAVTEFNSDRQKLILSEIEAEKAEINREYSEYREKSDTERATTLGAQFSNQFSILKDKLKNSADD